MKKKTFFLFLPFLASCSFSYPKAITLESASRLLKETIAANEEALSNKNRYGLGVTEIEDTLDASEDKIKTEKKTFFLLYFNRSNDSFSFDYFLKEGGNEKYLTLTKDGNGSFVMDNLSKEERPFDEEQDAYLERFYAFPKDIYKKIVKECLFASNDFLTSIEDTDIKNNLTSYSASSNGEGELYLSFRGQELALTSILEGNDVPESAFTGFDVSMSNGTLKSASLFYAYPIEETTNTKKGVIYLDFETI